MPRFRLLSTLFCISLFGLSLIYYSNMNLYSFFSSKNQQNPLSMDNSSTISYQDQGITLTLNNTVIFQNASISWDIP